MSQPPTDPVVARPCKMLPVRRACGHVESIPIIDDGRDAQRVSRKARKLCAACVAAHSSTHVGARIKKGAEPKLVPQFTQIVLTKQTDGRWDGYIIAPGAADQHASGSGLMGLISKLCRMLLREQGAPLKGKV